jgi:hypothetical protein
VIADAFRSVPGQAGHAASSGSEWLDPMAGQRWEKHAELMWIYVDLRCFEQR